jgi:hypothetical protein
MGKPRNVISKDSVTSVSGCECCPILEVSEFCQAHCLHVIGSRSSMSSPSPSPHYYGYDGEYSGAETEIHCYDPSSDRQGLEVAVHVDTQINTMTGIK